MNQKLLKNIIKNKELFIPLIFTKKQMNIMIKYSKKQHLSNAEKKSLYTSIKNKMKALETIKMKEKNEFYINGRNKMIQERLEKAKELIKEYSKKHEKVFISGSFLFSKKYNDIDIFIVRKRKYDEKWEDNKHIIFLTEKRLKDQVFQSAALISVSNFALPNKIKKKTIKLGEFMSSYHESAIEIRSNQERELTRYIVFTYYLNIKKELLDGLNLKIITKKLTLKELENFVKEILIKLFSKKYLYVAIHPYIKNLSEFIESEKNVENLKQYKSLYEEIIYGTKRSKGEA